MAALAVLSLLCGLTWATQEGYIHRQDDLFVFKSRPDLRAPRWNITRHNPALISPGHWFVTPYTVLPTLELRKEFMPLQEGPFIFDSNGELIWSGAEVEGNRVAFDLKTFQDGNATHLSYSLVAERGRENDTDNGAFVIMDDHYQKKQVIPCTEGTFGSNAHEFTVNAEEQTALLFASRQRKMMTANKEGERKEGRFADDCVAELDLKSGSKTWEWCPLTGGVNETESYDTMYDAFGHYDWDWMHANSIDTLENGDLIVSARFENTIYRVSKYFKAVNWRLGGKKSDFISNFNFSAQHDARIVSENETAIVLTLLDNASDDRGRQKSTSSVSSVKMVALYTQEFPMRAELVHQWDRPDGQLSRKRGSAQLLPSGNILAAWAQNGYMSEHTPEGEVVFEARFQSPRYDTYRAYKLPFVGTPIGNPAVKAFGYDSGAQRVTAIYASWNGATEILGWKFSGLENGQPISAYVPKHGFETSFVASGHWTNITASAVGGYSELLATSDVVEAEIEGSGEYAPASVPSWLWKMGTLLFILQNLVFGGLVYRRRRSATGAQRYSVLPSSSEDAHEKE